MNRVNYDEIVPQMKYFICRRCTPTWIMNDSIINFIDLTYIFDGKVTYTINGVPYAAEKGDLICIPKKSLRHAEIDPANPMACYASNFWLTDIKGEEVSLPFPIHSKIGVRDDLMTLYQELNNEWIQRRPGYGIKVRSIFLSILHIYFNILFYKDSFLDVDPRIQKAIRFIYDNYTTNIKVDDLASLVGLNASYFGTLFKRSTGSSVKEFINRVKVNHAESMLSSGEFSVNEVATRCGFSDAFYFSKVFKSLKGYSPSKTVINIFMKN